MTLYVLKNEHYLKNLVNLKEGDTVVLNNSISKFILDFILEDYDCNPLLINTFTLKDLIEGKLDHMKFNYIIGNPPYQDGTKAGGQNKIYNLISKKCLNLLTDDGIINFITPSSVTKENKRFSIRNIQGLKEVDFSINKHFNIGVSVCSWIIYKTYTGNVKIINSNNEISYKKINESIYDAALYSVEFMEIQESILKLTKNDKNNRMFTRNGTSNFKNLKNTSKTDTFKYPLYKLEDGYKRIIQYNAKRPIFYKKHKVNIAWSKRLDDDAIHYGLEDFEVNYLFTDCTEQEYKNIKSFILSEYFIQLSNQWRFTETHGFNYLLYYLPVFDKTKKWTNDEVKEFFKGLVKGTP